MLQKQLTALRESGPLCSLHASGEHAIRVPLNACACHPPHSSLGPALWGCRYGHVERVKLNPAPGTKHGQRWQFAFVQLGSAAEAEQAHHALQARGVLLAPGGAGEGAGGLSLAPSHLSVC